MRKLAFICLVVVTAVWLTNFKGKENRRDAGEIVVKSKTQQTRPDPIQSKPNISSPRHSLGCGPVPISMRGAPYNLDVFYQQYCDANGIPILASTQVNPDALRIAQTRLNILTQNLPPKVMQAMIDSQTRIAIIGKNEVVTDIPEKSDLNKVFKGRDWNRYRGVGPSMKRPVAITGEENILCLTGNQLPGSDTFIHEFGHTLHRMGLNNAEPKFQKELDRAFRQAVLKNKLWENAYASTNSAEYWAEGVRIWFNAHYTTNSRHKNYIKTKAQLRTYDPTLYNLVARYMPNKPILICPL